MTNIDAIIKKGYVQFNAGYIDIEEPNDKEMCEKFEKKLREGNMNKTLDDGESLARNMFFPNQTKSDSNKNVIHTIEEDEDEKKKRNQEEL